MEIRVCTTQQASGVLGPQKGSDRILNAAGEIQGLHADEERQMMEGQFS